MTFRRFSRVIIVTAIADMVTPNSSCECRGSMKCAVIAPSRLPPAVATSSSMPRRRLITCSRLRAAETELDVAITVVKLIAAATGNENLRTRVRNGTRNTPPARPSSDPRPPANTPATKMAIASDAVTSGINASSFHDADGRDGIALLQRRHRAHERDDAGFGGGGFGDDFAEVIGDVADLAAFVDVRAALHGRVEHAAGVRGNGQRPFNPDGMLDLFHRAWKHLQGAHHV